ncbi:MAG TPA: hypothetical protein PLJ47_07675 [Candidatus Hydrogenedentes bacterium]|nr:hypothetical protein [Candidatus Hydrogenedentota bacterium]HRK34461.1 hypothetical protein [Candidatus Hydrogenedentota bacterium]
MSDTTNSPLIAGPPPAEYQPVPNFMPGVDFENDSTYCALVADLSPENIELAKALYVSNGVAATAGRMLWPDLADETRKKRASRGANQAGVKALVDHFKERAECEGDERPVTLDEVKRKTRAMFRACKDAKVYESLLDRVIQMDGIKIRPDNAVVMTDLDEAMREADLILAGAPGQGHFTTSTVQ